MLEEEGLELTESFAKHAIKEYGIPVLILAAIYVLKIAGFLEFESMSGALSVGTFFGGIVTVILTIIICVQNLSKRLSLLKPETDNQLADSVSFIRDKMTEAINILGVQSAQSNQMHYLITHMYEVVKGVPNKHLIYEILTVRTKYLLNNCLEYILEYIVAKATPLDNDGIIRIQNTLFRNLARLKVDYMEAIVKISRSLINNEECAEIEDAVDKTISKMYSTLTEGNTRIEDVLFKTNIELKDLEDLLKTTFRTCIDIQITDPDYIL